MQGIPTPCLKASRRQATDQTESLTDQPKIAFRNDYAISTPIQ